MADLIREAQLVDRLRRAYACINDMLVYPPDSMRGSPKRTYEQAVLKAEKWLEERCGPPPMEARRPQDLDESEYRLL